MKPTCPACFGSLLLTASALAAEKLNVVFILADDLGWGELGSYGQKKIPTPHLDRLAAQGMRFTAHYSGAPVCAPSRCVLMTGKHLGHAEVRGNLQAKRQFPEFSEGQYPLTEQARTFAQLFRKPGMPRCDGQVGTRARRQQGDRTGKVSISFSATTASR